MGMKLKSGADLCGFELSRFCVQNDVAIPDAPASGRKYFHTGTGMEGKYSLLGRERIYTGTAWRSAAYVDDLANLDLATNADYLALKEKVDLLSGEVDTDAIINNMKEVTAFLSGFAEDANLMTMLNNKLDKTGGEITGSAAGLFAINRTSGNPLIQYKANGTTVGFLGFDTEYNPVYVNPVGFGTYKLLHSGNVGEYKAGDSDKLGGTPYYDYPKALFTNNLNPLNYTSRPLFITAFRTGEGTTADYGTLIVPTWSGNSAEKHYLSELRFPLDVAPQFRTSFNGEASDWKTIAFTDSNVASAQALVHSNGTVGAVVNSSGNVTIGASDLAGTSATAKLYVDGYVTTKDGVVINAADAYNSYWAKGFLFSSNSALNAGLWGYGYKSLEYLYLGFGNYSAAVGIRINENGNVGIGTADPRAKLHVGGDILLNNRNNLSWIKSDGNIQSILQLERDDKLYLGYGLTTSFTVYPLSIFENDIQSKGDIVAHGTIACKGVAAEGSAPVGTVDKWAGSIAIGTKSQPYTHGLGTTDITVAIYEKNGNEWVQILTDVDIVNANTIRVTFGANTTVEHRIVVMG